MPSIPPTTLFSNTFVPTSIPDGLQKSRIRDYLAIPPKNLFVTLTTTMLPTTITEFSLTGDSLNYDATWNKTWHTFAIEFTHKNQQNIHLVLLSFFVLLCMSSIIIILLIKVLRYFRKNGSLRDRRSPYRKICQYHHRKRENENNRFFHDDVVHDNEFEDKDKKTLINDHLIIKLHSNTTSKRDSCSTFTHHLHPSSSKHSIHASVLTKS